MKIDPNILAKNKPKGPDLTVPQRFAAISAGMHLSHPITDVDGVLLGIFVQLDKNGVMEVDGHIPFDVPAYRDLRKVVTDKHIVVVGRNTYEDIFHGEYIPDAKRVIVLAHAGYKPNGSGHPSIVHSPREVICKVKELGGKRAWVLGGTSTVSAMLPWSDLIFIQCADSISPGNHHVMYPQQLAGTIYGDGITWPELTQKQGGVTFGVHEYHRRDTVGRERDAVCAKCIFSAGCNGWEYTEQCLSGEMPLSLFRRGSV